MAPLEFCHWLKGFIDLADPSVLDETQVALLKEKLDEALGNKAMQLAPVIPASPYNPFPFIPYTPPPVFPDPFIDRPYNPFGPDFYSTITVCGGDMKVSLGTDIAGEVHGVKINGQQRY